MTPVIKVKKVVEASQTAMILEDWILTPETQILDQIII
jgi:hypothetical protein